MSTTSIGREAESRVAEHMRKQGYELLTQNWRTRFCEIDLVMKKKDVVYFIEVKYRSTDSQGSGLDYITPKKLKQMGYAAELWLSKNSWEGDALIGAVEVRESCVGELILVQP